MFTVLEYVVWDSVYPEINQNIKEPGILVALLVRLVDAVAKKSCMGLTSAHGAAQPLRKPYSFLFRAIPACHERGGTTNMSLPRIDGCAGHHDLLSRDSRLFCRRAAKGAKPVTTAERNSTVGS